MYIRVSYRIFPLRGGGYLDAFEGCMCVSAYPLGFCRVLDIFKDKSYRIQLYAPPIIMLPIAALEAISGRGGESQCTPSSV